ncbi:MAG: putative sulfate exporter family transporter [Gammaproteobacteria bacterium]|nr:putative sulfate exporter family transporter [Gammaproteobacteria bacterium]
MAVTHSQRSWPAAIPGLIAAGSIAACTLFLADWLGSGLFNLGKSPVSPVMLAVLAGVLIRNTVGVDARLERGLVVASSAVLRIGLALVGLRLSIGGLGRLGIQALPVVAGCMLTGWLLLPRLARAMNLQGALITLLTVGTTICGCTAILAVAPAIRARAEETGYAITLVVCVGLVGMLLYPFVANTLFGDDPVAAGIFLGASIHDTSQVVGAALLYSGQFQAPEALEAATVTKLLRNLTLLAVVPVVAATFANRTAGQSGGQKASIVRLLPGFVLAFVGMAVVRTLGDLASPALPEFSRMLWAPGLLLANQLSELLLTIGMAAVGLTVELSGLRRVGPRPLAAGVLAAVTMAVVCVVLLKTLR